MSAGEHVAKCYRRLMARRPEVSKPVLSPEDLAELRSKLEQMSVTGLKDFYQAAYHRCRMQDDEAPLPRQIQELVQAWRQLRKF